MRTLRLMPLILSLFVACDCEDTVQTKPEPRYDFQELFTVEEFNISQHERMRMRPYQIDTAIVETKMMSEQVKLTNKLDLFIILDSSPSMAPKSANFIAPNARAILQTMLGGKVEDVDLRVKFLNAGKDGHLALLDFYNKPMRSELLTKNDDDTYRYPIIRAMIKRIQSFADDQSLDDYFNTNSTFATRSAYDGWNDMVPEILGGESFQMTYGDGALEEWVQLHSSTGMSGGGVQDFLLTSLLQYAREPTVPGFPRDDSLIAVLMLTDDGEEQAFDLSLSFPKTVKWTDYANDICPGTVLGMTETYPAAQTCKNEVYSKRTLQYLKQRFDNKNILIFDMSCVDTFSPTNPNCVHKQVYIDSGEQLVPPYKTLSELSGGLHLPLPAAQDAAQEQQQFVEGLSTFAQNIRQNTKRLITLQNIPHAPSVALSYNGTNIPRVDDAQAKGFRCVDERGADFCQALEIVGYDTTEIPVDANIDVTYLPYGVKENTPPLNITLSKTPRPGSVEVWQFGRRLSAVDYQFNAQNKTVTIAKPKFGAVNVGYLLKDEDALSFVHPLKELPFHAPIMLWIEGQPWSLCAEDSTPETREGCFLLRDYRYLEIWRRKTDQGLYPNPDHTIEVIYAKRPRLRDESKHTTETIQLAKTPTSPDKLSVFTIETLPEAIETPPPPQNEAYRDIKALDALGAFKPMAKTAYTYDAQSNTITLTTPLPYKTPILVTYDAQTGVYIHQAPQASQALTAPILSQLQATDFYQTTCMGPNQAPFDDQSTMALIDTRAQESTMGYMSTDVTMIQGPAKRISGLTEHQDIVIYDADIDDQRCPDLNTAVEAMITSSVSIQRQWVEGDFPTSTCLAIRAYERCQTTTLAVRLAASLAELARHSDEVLSNSTTASKIELLDIAQQLTGSMRALDPGHLPSMAIEAFTHHELAKLQPEQATYHIQRAQQLMLSVATISQTATMWDLLALYGDHQTFNGGATSQAARMAVAIAPKNLSARGAQNATTAQAASDCDNGSCEKYKCKLNIQWYMGMHPAVQIGKNVQSATEYAICELITGGCYAACQSGGDVPSGCKGFKQGLPNVDEAADLLQGLFGGSPVTVGIGANQDGDTTFSAAVSTPNFNGVKVSAGVSGVIPSQDSRGGGGLSSAYVTNSHAGVSVGHQGFGVGAGLSHNHETGQSTVSTSVSAPNGIQSGSMTLFQIPSPEKQMANCP